MPFRATNGGYLHSQSVHIFLIFSLATLVAIGCASAKAGNDSGTGSGAAATADFNIAAASSQVNLTDGASSSIVFSGAAINGFSQTINVSLSGVPSSVTVSPTTFSLAPGTQQTVTFTASNNAPIGTAQVSVQATAGSLSHSIQLVLQVASQAPPAVTAHAPIRTRYLRTNSFYDPNSLEYAPPHFTVYDAVHRQFFMSNPYLNEVDVFDAKTELQIATIPIPLAWGLDIAPTGNKIYVATLLGDIYSVDTNKNIVLQRYPASAIGPQGYAPTQLFVLSDGRLALLGALGGLPYDGSGSIAVWDPVSNSLDAGTPINGPPRVGTVCPNIPNIGAFAVSGDRKFILAATIDSGGGGESLCSYDPVAKKASTGVFTPDTFVRQIIPSPDGNRFFLTTNQNGVAIFDTKTLTLLGQMTGPTYTPGLPGLPNAAGGAVLSIDGKTLYLMDQSAYSVGAYDTTSLTLRNWIPAFKITDAQAFVVISAIDETGLILGPMGHGAGFVDTAASTATTLAGFLGSVSPSTGTAFGGTAFQVNTNYRNNFPGLASLYMGQSTVSGTAIIQNQNSPATISGNTPPSATIGPVDVTAVLKDGITAISPEGFSYGPTILEVVPNASTAEGGTTGAIIGYGFGTATTSGLQIFVGGQNANIKSISSVDPAYYPFPVETLLFTIPPGTAGTSVDVTVGTVNGQVTKSGAFHYVAPVKSFPLKANLQQGFCDSKRDLYFFTDTVAIQVLSARSGWQMPISLPGITAKSGLLAISESPDHSLLAVSDFTGQAIYVLNPDNPASVQRFPMTNSLLGPSGLAITNSKTIYFVTADLGGTGTPAFHKLDISAGKIKDLGSFASLGSSDSQTQVLLSPDGARIYSKIEGAAFWLDTSTDTIHNSFNASTVSGARADIAISRDGSTLADGYLSDSSFNAISVPAYIDWESWLPSATLGQKLYDDGSILVQPLTDGVDLVSRTTGRLLNRVQVPFSVANVFDSVVAGLTPGSYGFITATGVNFVDLSGLTFTTPVGAFTTQQSMTTSKDLVLEPQAPRAIRNLRSQSQNSVQQRH